MEMLKDGKRLIWTDLRKKILNNIKLKVKNIKKLDHPRMEDIFIIVCDSSEDGYGGCLCQYQLDQNGNKIKCNNV